MSVKRREDSVLDIRVDKARIAELEAAKAALTQQVTDLQIALCDVYEILVGGTP